jgi:hypothetical protein
MPYKVRVKHVGWMGDRANWPCHFGYKVGDEFTFDGEEFVGRVCGGVMVGDGMEVIHRVRYSGLKQFQYNPLMYIGAYKRDPSMKKYDGEGWANVKGLPEGTASGIAKFLPYLYPMIPPIPTERRGAAEFHCPDPRTEALFVAEPYDLADRGMDIPYYNREMSILEKIKAEPGMKADEILNKFTQFEREEIYPALGPALLGIYLEELETVGYINLKDGKAHPTAKGKAKSTEIKTK